MRLKIYLQIAAQCTPEGAYGGVVELVHRVKCIRIFILMKEKIVTKRRWNKSSFKFCPQNRMILTIISFLKGSCKALSSIIFAYTAAIEHPPPTYTSLSRRKKKKYLFQVKWFNSSNEISHYPTYFPLIRHAWKETFNLHRYLFHTSSDLHPGVNLPSIPLTFNLWPLPFGLWSFPNLFLSLVGYNCAMNQSLYWQCWLENDSVT